MCAQYSTKNQLISTSTKSTYIEKPWMLTICLNTLFQCKPITKINCFLYWAAVKNVFLSFAPCLLLGWSQAAFSSRDHHLWAGWLALSVVSWLAVQLLRSSQRLARGCSPLGTSSTSKIWRLLFKRSGSFSLPGGRFGLGVMLGATQEESSCSHPVCVSKERWWPDKRHPLLVTPVLGSTNSGSQDQKAGVCDSINTRKNPNNGKPK